MSRRAPEAVDVATGGRPEAAVAAVAAARLAPGCVFRVCVEHDPGCPCPGGRPLAACTCAVVTVSWRRIA